MVLIAIAIPGMQILGGLNKVGPCPALKLVVVNQRWCWLFCCGCWNGFWNALGFKRLRIGRRMDPDGVFDTAMAVVNSGLGYSVCYIRKKHRLDTLQIDSIDKAKPLCEEWSLLRFRVVFAFVARFTIPSFM